MLIWITFAAVAVAVVSTVFAWRAVGEQRRRSAARVAALSRDIYSSRFDLDLQPASRLEVRPPNHPGGSMFAHVGPAPGRPRVGLALAILAFVAATAGAAAIALGGAFPSVASVANPTGEEARGDSGPAPSRGEAAALELVALAHEREGDRLVVRGTVRNPAGGAELDRLAAVVFLFDRDGGFLASGRAALDSPALIPGGESPFAVIVRADGEVARYRISFRSGDRIVAHVDRRAAASEGTTP